MTSKKHWETIYATKAPESLSWYQAHADDSLQLLQAAGLPLDAAIIDVGGGASTLVDDLLNLGYQRITVLDLSGTALAVTKERLGARAAAVQWLEADILTATLPDAAYDVWHDRAVFHFLTSPADQQAYVQAVLQALKPGGTLLLATFAEDGPTTCSGLPVVRYSPERLLETLGTAFSLLSHERFRHRTPGGAEQHFLSCRFQLTSP
ncbi:class I SAM-dependent methyltransferase [Cyanobium sp. ATX 6F1]|uniref:class I SAM-dependent methyltransferase n=1 Tax=unclassified Cyanobium TaxID=2627006 RepID=UPI0020CC637C|nr:class I SAM-dependent methyltransferase [Cyanobium sp. ATX 6F1]MCP9915309.1 class I SAM-dependent methyltransferase [Cyanobium sp. ATX 6F1]